MNKKFMYGIGAVYYNDKLVGYIEKDSFEFGGEKPEVTNIEAEQVQGAPVLIIPQTNGKITPQFNMIQLDFDTLQQFLGGALQKDSSENVVGWVAPKGVIVLNGPWKIDLVSGQSILIPSALLSANLDGKLALTETAKIAAQLDIQQPDSGAPYGVYNTDSVPGSWTSGHTLPAAEE